ncbi:hypothetical protein RZS08_15250 [Arthrospira platensis SPKY1]|nr:hypothetical protein [Arthrospira platensis SPKY1]
MANTLEELLDQTFTQVFAFGDRPEDHFFCLIDRSVNADGLNVEEMAAVNPMRIEDYLQNNGCLIMIDGRDMLSIVDSLEVEGEALHRVLIQLARQQNLS